MNFNASPNIVDIIRILSVPSFAFYIGGQKVDQLIGGNTNALRQKLQAISGAI